MAALQLVFSLAKGTGKDPLSNSAVNKKEGIGMPPGRSPGSISAIYSGLDKQAAFDLRKGNSQSSESARLNEQAVK